MFRHNLLMIYRNFKRNKSTFFINLIGLSTGIACSLLICLWVNDELSVDSFHDKDNQLYQVMQNFQLSNGIVTWDYTPALLADALLAEMPEVEFAVSVNSRYTRPQGILSNGEKNIRASGKYASKDFFQVFSYNLIQGDSKLVLQDVNAIVLSKGLAQKLFTSTENIIGKTIKGNHDLYEGLYVVTGVFENLPANSTDQFDFLFNYELLLANQAWTQRWESDAAETYLILKKATNINQFNKKIAGFLRSKTPTREPSTLFVQQYSKRYLYGNYENGLQSGGRIVYIRLFSMIAFMVLLIGCINFMNLSTAKASTRLKEIGVMKAIGANRKTLMVQYLGEAILMAFLSLFFAFLLIELLLPQYNAITGKHLLLNFNIELLISILGITLFTGIISGSYPALYLSSFHPVNILKGKLKTFTSEVWIRKGLVIFQFGLSIIFIIGVLVINKQIELTQIKNLGYNRNNVLCFQWKPLVNNDLSNFVSGLKNIPGVLDASQTSGSIVNDIYIGSGYSWKGQDSDKDYAFKNLQGGNDYIETLGIELLEGQSFSSNMSDKNSKIVLNEAAVKKMGLLNPIGKNIVYGNEGDTRQIIGVVKDFHYGSLHNYVEPLIISYNPWGRNILVKISDGMERETIERLEKFYNEFNPNLSFEFTFLDDEYQALYDSESKVAILSKYFAGVAIIVSCLGLFGLAAFTAQKRQKEIGIRKVLGASVPGVLYLLSRDFLGWVLLANVLAWPVAWYAMHKWLQNFAYRITMQWWIFVLAGMIVMVIALATIGLQVLRAARANPIEVLRYE